MLVRDDHDYSDDSASCDGTYVTLRLYSEEASADVATAALGLAPTETLSKGWRSVPAARPLLHHAWFLGSENSVASRDFRRHLDWLLDQLTGREEALLRLQAEGWSMSVSVYWVSRNGHGGPALWPRQMRALGSLNLDIWFDIYFAEPDDRPLSPGEFTADFRRAASHWRRFGFGRSKN